jgi:hypothetical protein
MPRLATLFAEEFSGIPGREAIVRQLEITAEMMTSLDPGADEQIAEVAEDLRYRLNTLFRR